MAEDFRQGGQATKEETLQLGQVGIDGSLVSAGPQASTVAPSSDEDLIESGEHVLAVVRKHWIGVADIYGLTFVCLVTLILLGIFVLPDMNLSSQAAGLLTLGAIAIAVIMSVLVFTMIYIYHKSNLTLTDKSLVQVVQRGLFNKKISRLSMSNVEDVNVDQRGVISHLLNFGTLTVQTAGAQDNFVFSNCPNATVYAEKILEARQAYVKQHQE